MKKIIFGFAVILSTTIYSQILNVDRENGQDSIARKQLFSWNVSFSSDKQKKNLLELTNVAEYDRFFKNDQVLITLLNTDASFRFERGIDPNITKYGSTMLTKWSLFNLYSILLTKHPFKYMNNVQLNNESINVNIPNPNGANRYIIYVSCGVIKCIAFMTNAHIWLG